MKTAKEHVQKLALPVFLRKGFEAIRVGEGKNQNYVIRSKWKDQTYQFKAWQFFILEVLPGCEDYAKLADVFNDRYGHVVTESEVNAFLSSVADKGLFGEAAGSHPMLSPHMKKIATLAGETHPQHTSTQKRSDISEARDAGAVYSRSDLPPIGNAAQSQSNKGGHLARAMQKARLQETSANPVPTNEPPQVQPQQNPYSESTAKRNVTSGTPLSSALRTATTVNEMGSVPKVDPLEVEQGNQEQLPAGVQDAVGLDNTMNKRGWKLFNPTWLLKLLLPILSPFKYAIYLLPLLIITATFIAVRHSFLLEEALGQFITNTSLLEHAILSMVTVNLIVTMTAALIAYNYRATVEGFCIVLYMLFLPRFMVRISNAKQLTRRERIWLHAGPLLMRLALCSFGIVLWFTTRPNNEVLATFAFALTLSGAISFLITANPLIKSNGYQLLSAFFNEPQLRRKAYKALLNKIRGNVYRQTDDNILIGYALASIIYSIVFVAAMLYIFSLFLEVEIGTASVLVIGTIVVLLSLSLIKRFRKIDRAYDRSIQYERWRKRTFPQIEDDSNDKKKPKTSLTFLRRSALLVILAILFLPYTYEPSGNFIVMPNEQQNISASVPGIIDEIYYDGGEVLTKGTIIAKLSYSDYESQVKIYSAKIDQQQAVINELKAKPRPEELQLAKSALSTQRTQANFSKAKAARYDKLFKEGVISFEDLDDARRQYEVDVDQVQEKLANLELVKSGATPEELAEAEAELQSYQEERAHFQDKINQSILKMPFDGKLITLHLKQQIGSYLNKGVPLAVAEQADKVIVEIEIPETDIAYVAENSEIRFRFHVYYDEYFQGIVKTIDSNVEERQQSKVIKVVALLENPDDRLKSGMTGYAKIIGEKMPIWKVFSLSIIRFIQVEVWSWLP